MAEQLIMRGELHGHTGWVTSLATSMEKYVKRIKTKDINLSEGTDRLLAPTCSSPLLATRL